MRKTLMLIPLGVLAVLSVSTGAVAQDKAATDARAAIDKVTAQFAAAMNSGNFGELGALYAHDAILLPDRAPVAKGREAIQNFWNGMSAYKVSDVKLTADVVEVHGDVAVETGAYSMMVTPPGATAAVSDVGKYMVIWKREGDGSWKIYRDMWSTNAPPPAE